MEKIQEDINALQKTAGDKEQDLNIYRGYKTCIAQQTFSSEGYQKAEEQLAEQKEEKGKKREQKGGDNVSEEKHIKYYMTEHGQIFKFDRTKFISCELDLQNMVSESGFYGHLFWGIYKIYRA